MAPAKNAEPGDNRKAEELRKVLFFKRVEEIMDIDAAIAIKRDERKKAIGRAKADGISAKKISFAASALTVADTQSFLDNFLEDGEVLEWCGMFPGFQADLFRDRMPADERIEKAGELAGLTNRPRESEYAPDSRETQIWLKAYDKARKLSLDTLAEALEQAEQTRQADTKKTKKKAAKSKAGEPLTGATPDDDKQAANQNGEAPTPPKPPKPDEEGLTNAEAETVRQARAMFTVN